jgi:hypothetical protein
MSSSLKMIEVMICVEMNKKRKRKSPTWREIVISLSR